MLLVQAESPETMGMVESDINSLLRQRHKLRADKDNDFYVRT